MATRLTELWLPDKQPTLEKLILYQESGSPLFPVDAATDCRDFCELATGSKSLPQDKLQRLYLLAIKEARVTGRLQNFMLIPTQCMTADALTKPMVSYVLNKVLSSGYVRFWNEDKHPALVRRLPTLAEISEEDLYKADDKVKKEVLEGRPILQAFGATTCAALSTRPLLCAAMMIPGARAQGKDPEDLRDSLYFILMLLGGYVALRVIEEFLKWIRRSLTWTAPVQAQQPLGQASSSAGEETTPTIMYNHEVFASQRVSSERQARNRRAKPGEILITSCGDCYHQDPMCRGVNGRPLYAKRACKLCGGARSSSGV